MDDNGLLCEVSDHSPLISTDVTRRVIQGCIETYRMNYPVELTRVMKQISRRTKSGDNFSPRRTLRRAVDVPPALYWMIARALDDNQWIRHKATLAIFKSEMPACVYPQTSHRTFMVDGLRPQPETTDEPTDLTGDDHAGGTIAPTSD